MLSPQELFTLLSDETRLRSLFLLQKEKELCVCELVQIIESIQPKISRHLALLRQSDLVSDERRGQWIYYRLNTETEPWVQEIIMTICNNLEKREPYRSDFKKLQKLRKSTPCAQ